MKEHFGGDWKTRSCFANVATALDEANPTDMFASVSIDYNDERGTERLTSCKFIDVLYVD
jgi:hypothetical protein